MYVNTERNLLTENLDGWKEVLLEEYRSGNNISEVGEHDIQCTLNKEEVLDYIGKDQWKSATNTTFIMEQDIYTIISTAYQISNFY